MDNDQEVVREPFEDNHCSREQSDIADGISNNACHSRHHSITETDHTDRMYQDGSSSSADSCPSPRSLVEEVKFAKSYGIDIAHDKKQTRSNPIYESLLNSDHFEANQSSDQTRPKPMIKTSVTSDCIYHKGTFYQKGDIVALCDQDDGQLYFAQITGFLQDQYCEKSASVNWLVPHKPTSRDFFDPSAYKIGLEDVTLRKLDCMTFVRHCPHDYYIRKFFQNSGDELPQEPGEHSEVDLREKNKEKSYIWTTMKPCPVPQIEACSRSTTLPLASASSHQQHKPTLSMHADLSP